MQPFILFRTLVLIGIMSFAGTARAGDPFPSVDLELLTHLINNVSTGLSNAVMSCGDTLGTDEGEDLLKDLDAAGTVKRNDLILKLIQNGHYLKPVWRQIETTCLDKDGIPVTATISVATDALQIGKTAATAVRISASPKLVEQLHVELGRQLGFELIMPTKKVIDGIHAQAELRAQPCPMQSWPLEAEFKRKHKFFPPERMGTVDALRRHDRCVSEQLRGKCEKTPCEKLVSNVGKTWILDIRHNEDGRDSVTPECRPGPKDRSVNYGWYLSTKSALPITQSPGICHNYAHHDYSQNVRLMKKLVRLTTAQGISSENFDMLLNDPYLYRCVSDSRLDFGKYRGL